MRQSVEGKSYETPPRYGFDVSDSVALVSSGIVGISPECSMTRRFSRRGSHVIRRRGLAKRWLRRGAGRGGWLVGLAAAAYTAIMKESSGGVAVGDAPVRRSG